METTPQQTTQQQIAEKLAVTDRSNDMAAEYRAKTAAILKENEALKAKLQALQEQEDRILQFQNSAEPAPFQFPAVSSPIKDIQIAYRMLPVGVLSPEQLKQLDQAVEDEDMGPVIDIFNGLVQDARYEGNKMIIAIEERALDNEVSPGAYRHEDSRVQQQKILATAIILTII